MPAKPSPSFVSTVINFFGDPRKPEQRKTLGQKMYWGVIAFGLFMAVSMLATIPSGRASENVIPSLLTGVFLIALTVAVGRKPRKPLAIAASVVLFVLIGATTPASSRTGDGGADPTPGASSKPTPNVSSAPSSRCIAVSPLKLETMLPLTAAGGGTMRNGWAVKSSDFSKVWFLAAEMDFAGAEGNGEIGVWAVNDLTPFYGTIFSVNSFALEFTNWGNGPATSAQLSMNDDGASEAEACVKSNQ